MSTLAEMPCYTLINVPSDVEAWSEQKLKDDLGKFDSLRRHFLITALCYRVNLVCYAQLMSVGFK